MREPGDRLKGENGTTVELGPELGTGGQGTVYRGRTAGGDPVAVKWFFPDYQKPEMRVAISALLGSGAPSAHFLWPSDILTADGEFGYVMPLRPPQFTSLTSVLARKAKVTFRELIRASAQTVAAFKALQARGLFYCDISDANLFIDPSNGDVLICDNDNVGSSRGRPRVLGTARFMAPEIVRGEKTPSALTDSFSMAVLLFLVLMNDHPLQGAAESRIHVFDHAAMKRIYGTHPVFIFDPEDASNRPVKGVHLNAEVFWKIYPQVLRDIFVRVFTDGLHDPGKRPTFGEWQAAIAAVSDSMIVCSCGRQNFVDGTKPVTCWGCSRRPALPARVIIEGKRTVMLTEGTCLYGSHFARTGDPAAAETPRARVVKHPQHGVLGLTNLGTGQWYVQIPGKEGRTVEPGSSVRLVSGTSIHFGDANAVVEA